MKKLEIKIPIFDQKVFVIKAEDMKTIDNYVEDIYDIKLNRTDAEYRDASTYLMLNGDILIGLLPKATDRIIVHETGHTVFELLNILGIDPTKDQETFCYLQDYLFDKISR